MMISTIAAAAISLVVGYAVSLFLWFSSMSSLVAESLFADATYSNGKDDDVGNSIRSEVAAAATAIRIQQQHYLPLVPCPGLNDKWYMHGEPFILPHHQPLQREKP